GDQAACEHHHGGGAADDELLYEHRQFLPHRPGPAAVHRDRHGGGAARDPLRQPADVRCSWLENLLMHEYTECYLYYSMLETETCPAAKKVWELHLEQEIAHLHHAAHLLEVYEGKQWQQVIPDGTFPDLLELGPNIEYVREVLANTVTMTA